MPIRLLVAVLTMKKRYKIKDKQTETTNNTWCSGSSVLQITNKDMALKVRSIWTKMFESMKCAAFFASVATSHKKYKSVRRGLEKRLREFLSFN